MDLQVTLTSENTLEGVVSLGGGPQGPKGEQGPKGDSGADILQPQIDTINTKVDTWTTFKTSGGTISGLNKIGGTGITATYSNDTLGGNLSWNVIASNGTSKGIVFIGGTNDTDGILRCGGSNNGKISIGDSGNSWTDIWLNGVSKTTNGYTKLPNGMIMQWGRATLTLRNQYQNNANITLPITFPNSLLVSTCNTYGQLAVITTSTTITNNTINLFICLRDNTVTASLDVPVNWIAIGY